MKVLVACEYSGTVRDAFTALGHYAVSCDWLPSEKPGIHYQMDAIEALYSQKWNHVVAHPPCDRLANSGVRWLTSRNPRAGYEWNEKEQIFVNSDSQIWIDLYNACSFFNHFVLYGKLGNSIRIENPIQHKYARRLIDPPSQIIQPWMFGHGETKATCIWNYNVQNIIATEIVTGREQKIWKMPPSKDRAKLRSKTFPGIAKAMAEQWG